MKSKLTLFTILFSHLILFAQQPVPVGKGSYAEYPPRYVSWTAEHHGDKSQQMLNKKLYITDKMKGKPVPTNDWWTDLLVSQYSGNLWAYPIVVNAEEYGIYVEYPTVWTSDGCEMKSKSRLQIGAKQFRPASAEANGWHDWGFDFIMQDGDKQMQVTLAHGMPFTWIEGENLVLQIPYKGEKLYNVAGNEVSLPIQADQLVFQSGDDAYGLYAPVGTHFSIKNDILEVTFPDGKQYLSVAVLPRKELLSEFATYAYTIPRDTKVVWNYDEKNAKLHTTWTITTEHLKGDNSNKKLLQGFIPHHYKRSEFDFSFVGYEYDTPRGRMKMAVGEEFKISYDFNGIIPYWAAPELNGDISNPYERERMKLLISQYADNGNFGGDTYWGGKGLIQMAQYMTFAHELGETELFEKCKNRLCETLVNWFTFTPGESTFFFARYENWKAMVGYATSYDSDTFNDHHFHYGYFTYAASLLALFDEDFKRDYGGMITHVAKDYANWDRDDNSYPLFRTFDPWAGHSYAGGLGGWNGNGQESTSESMQGWGGVYMLGLAMNDKTIRDAGIFGWLLESRGVGEYWFDRDRENINYDLYTRPYNSNLTSQGIGWWTWFDGDPVWMHSIQWLPISPLQKHLYEDLEYAEWEYTQMWEKKEIGGWSTDPNAERVLSKESGLGNVVLSYLQIFNPDSAAAVFDSLWEHNMPLAKNTDTGGISYYLTHSHRTYGDIQWDIYGDMASSTCYYNDRSGAYTYMVYNPEVEEKTCTFYKREGSVVKSFKVPGRKFIAYREEPELDKIEILAPAVIELSTSVQLTAKAFDQYGAIVNTNIQWSATGNGTITSTGQFTASSQKGSATITANVNGKNTNVTIRIDNKPILTEVSILPEVKYLVSGNSVSFYTEQKDQYGNKFNTTNTWTIEKDGKVVKNDSAFNLSGAGKYTVKALVDGKTYETSFTVLPAFPNIAIGKKALASTSQGNDVANNVTDEDPKSRWESKHEDNQWIYVDLGEKCDIVNVNILWEPAYASVYEIQTSDDSKNWTTAKKVYSNGKYDIVPVNSNARYIKMNGLERATTYGFSIYEFEVYGISPSMDMNSVVGMQITPDDYILKEDVPVKLKATAYNGLGEEVPANISWSVDGKGEIAQDGTFVPRQYGNVTVTAQVGKAKTDKSYYVEESLKLKYIHLEPKNASIILGHSQVFKVTAQDQFMVDFPIDEITYKVIGEGASFDKNSYSFTSDRTGSFMLIACNGEEETAATDTAYIAVSRVEEANLALNKRAYASSSESEGLLPKFANDGDMSTRWSSGFEDNQYLMFDLESGFIIDRVVLFWESSHATSYKIDVSTNEDDWTTVYTNLSCKGGEETVSFDPVAARYVRVVCLTRSSDYGASLLEVEVYGTKEWIDPKPARFVLTPNPLEFYMEETAPLTVAILDQYGMPFTATQNILLSVNGGGSFDDNFNFTSSQMGEFELTASYGFLIKKYAFNVCPKKQLDKLAVNYSYYKLKVGEPLQLIVKGLDQYGNDYPVEISWETSGGAITKEGLFTATAAGKYTVTATSQGKKVKTSIEVILVDKNNLALNKHAEASSNEDGAKAAVDGNDGSRWESAHQDGPEWLMVDLEAAYLVTDVEISWETASAADYEIQMSADGESWSTVSQVTGKSGERTDEFRLSATGRYIRIYCTRRSTGWGYSIFELRVFGSAMKAGEPYVISMIDPVTEITIGDVVTYKAEVQDCEGQPVLDYPLIWSVTGGGVITSEGVFTARSIGDYFLNVSCGLVSASQQILSRVSVDVESYVEETSIEIIGSELRVHSAGLKQVALYDYSGKMVDIQNAIDQNECILNIDGKNGLFILQVKTIRGVEVKKLNLR